MARPTHKTSEIKITVDLDENHIPEKMHWSASDGGVNGPCKAFMLSVWDSKENNTLRIDLWNKEMTVDDMKKFAHQTIAECQTCRGTFVPRVLEYNPQAQSDQIANEFQSIYEKAMRHSMVLMMLADGHIDDNEMKTVLEIINKYGHHDLSIGDLEDYVKQVQRQQEPVGTYLKKVGPSLNEHGKELIIKCAIAVASSDGHIDDSEISLIHEMAKEMEMSSSHLKGILTENLPEQASLN